MQAIGCHQPSLTKASELRTLLTLPCMLVLLHSQAAVELFLRLNHARQTMDFVKRQVR